MFDQGIQYRFQKSVSNIKLLLLYSAEIGKHEFLCTYVTRTIIIYTGKNACQYINHIQSYGI